MHLAYRMKEADCPSEHAMSVLPSFFLLLLSTRYVRTHTPKVKVQSHSQIVLREVMFSQARQMYLMTYCFPHFKYLRIKCPLINLGETKCHPENVRYNPQPPEVYKISLLPSLTRIIFSCTSCLMQDYML